MIETEDQIIHDWLCGESCICQNKPVETSITPSSIHSERWDLIRVIRAQHDGPSNQWWDVFCIEDDTHHEVSNGPRETLERFADRLIDMGWAVHSVDKGTAICKECSNKEDESHYARQYQSDSGGILD